jgi:hypothetical protein
MQPTTPFTSPMKIGILALFSMLFFCLGVIASEENYNSSNKKDQTKLTLKQLNMEAITISYGFRILPAENKIKAIIYKKVTFVDKSAMEFVLTSKYFGSIFKSAGPEEYKKAKEWTEMHMQNIFNSNKGTYQDGSTL